MMTVEVPETPAVGATTQSGRAVTPRDRLNRIRSAIAAQRSSLQGNLAARGIAMQRTYGNLPYFVTTVDAAGLERLTREPGLISITLNQARRPGWATSQREIVEKVFVVPDDSSDTASDSAATAQATAAEERAERSAATGGATPSLAATPLLDTSVTYINADEAWNQGVIGTGQVIAILDDGIDSDHQMFVGKIVAEACFSDTFDSSDESLCANGANSQIGTGAASSCNGGPGSCDHGSHVAGIAAGNDQIGSVTRRGVAYGASLLPIQVFTLVNDSDACDGEESCELSYDSASLAALNHVIDLTDTMSIAAANMSLGAELTPTACDNNIHKQAIDTLRTLGVLTAIAAGNAEAVGEVEHPGCISTAITVSSVIVIVPDDSVNHASLVDMLAPGVFIVSAVNNNYAAFSGTSMATPHVAGAIALLKSAKPTATANEIENALESTGTLKTLPAWSWSTPLINVSAALDALNGVASGGSVSGRVVPGVFASNRTKAESYIRFYNTSSANGTVTVDVVDDLTGETAGTFTRNILDGASVQVSMATIEANASPPIVPDNGNTQSYTLHVNAEFSGYVQHVLWNPAGGSLTNASGCDNGLSNSGSDLGNIHTSLISDYPSYLLVYNGGAAAAKPVFAVTDARNGETLGNFTLVNDIAPNMSVEVFVSDLVEFFGGTPDSSQFHLNVELQSSFTGFAQHIVDNVAGYVLTNMTAKCDL
jgi:subtilisin family serine protease